ncbi:polyprotein [Elysia marginata]|uniref:Polyprotein n=1 Tax=Elysia marginata TaxID=1093978 RepID=A0AAV4JGG6_9GAST|nr:polyprotein [Elysia marginata]
MTCESVSLNWKQELPYFLRQYRTTLHSTAKISPHEAATGWEMQTSLPEKIHPGRKSIKNITDNHCSAMGELKAYADHRCKAVQHKIQKRDTVLVGQPRLSKLTPPYNPNPYIVTDLKGI